MSASWILTGNMIIARQRHTAIGLHDGRVLVAGGLTANNETTATAELYDPVTGNWSQTSNMSSPRSRQTATLLNDGKVLVAGGRSQSDVSLASAEVYDPATGRWSPIGSMSLPRDQHTATLLQDGRVLVAGGVSFVGPQHDIEKSVEIYDPGAGVWNLTDHMANVRFGHRATLLPDRRVLVTGGSNNAGVDCGSSTSSEIYDSGSARWAFAASMNTARGFHPAVQLSDGRVLVAGGFTPPPDCNTATAVTEIYDSKMGKWAITGSMVYPRGAMHPCALLANGTVLVAGGKIQTDSTFSKTETTELYDPITGTWRLTASMSSVRTGHSLTILSDGRVLTTGGRDNANTLSTAEVFTL